MKVICSQAVLNKGLAAVSHIAASRNTLPILSSILLATDHDRLKLAATNLEIGINYWIDAQIQEEGATTVPARLLTDLVSRLPQTPVELSANEKTHTLNVQSLGSTTNIRGMDALEFPRIPNAEGGDPPVSLDATLLKEIIEEVAFAAATDETRPVLTGVLVQVGDEKLTFAAADAFRLAVRVAPLPGDSLPRGDILIPARTLTELARILPSEGTVEMIATLNRHQVLFHTPDLDLVSRLIEGTFPNFRQIIPQDHSTRVVMETKDFAEKARCAELFARDSSNITRITIKPGANDGLEPGSITIEATAEDLGDNTSTVAAAVEGKEMQIIFNVKYLSEALSVIDTPEVALEVTSPAKPGIVRPVGSHDYICVVMPMHINR